MEIGFNAGHSALLALACNPGLRYVGVDICEHDYTKECARYLAGVFDARFKLIEGDSRDVLPHLATHGRNMSFDIFHLDGGHEVATCRSDISHVIRLADAGSTLVLDDTNLAHISEVYSEFEQLGYLRTENLDGSWQGREQVLAEIKSRGEM